MQIYNVRVYRTINKRVVVDRKCVSATTGCGWRDAHSYKSAGRQICDCVGSHIAPNASRSVNLHT